jgi:hypothetical protein
MYGKFDCRFYLFLGLFYLLIHYLSNVGIKLAKFTTSSFVKLKEFKIQTCLECRLPSPPAKNLLKPSQYFLRFQVVVIKEEFQARKSLVVFFLNVFHIQVDLNLIQWLHQELHWMKIHLKFCKLLLWWFFLFLTQDPHEY